MSAAPSDPRSARLPSIGVTVLVSLLLRLGMSAMHGYGVDEAYAITVAAPFSLSYFDHPPLTFWLAGGSVRLFQSSAPFFARLPFVLLFTVTHWCIGHLAQRAFSDRAGRIATLALASSGVLGIVDGMWVLPDGPLIAFAALGCVALLPLALTDDPELVEHSERRWLVAGVAFGLAGLAKYHAVLLVLGVLTFLLTDVRMRRQFRTRGPWMALAIMLVLGMPVLLWNARNDWASFAFQSSRAGPRTPSIVPMLENLAGQAAWMLPWIFVPLGMAFAAALRRGRADRASWFFVCLAAWPVAVFTLIALGGSRGLPHWQAPGWLFAFPLLGFSADRAWRAAARWPRVWIRASGGATLLTLAVLMVYVQVPSVASRLGLNAQRDPASDLVSWEPVIHAITRQDAVDPTVIVAARSWIQAGQLGASFVDGPPIVCLCTDSHHFAWRSAAVPSWDVVILADRLQPMRRGWLPAERSFADSAWQITSLDTVRLDRDVRIALYRIVRSQPVAN